MKFQFSLGCCRLTLEFFRLGTEPVLRRDRIVAQEAATRRRMLREVHRRLVERSKP